MAKPTDQICAEVPTREGHFWARWHTPAPGTADNGEMCCDPVWEVVQVFKNGRDPARDDHLRVFVTGVIGGQPLDAFEWGPEVPGNLEPQRLIARLLAALARATPAPDDAEAGAVIEEARRYLAGCA